MPLWSVKNRGERFGEFESRSVKTRGFSPAGEFSQLCRGFHQAMKALITCFISFIKLLFSVLTKRKTLYEARMYT